MSRGCGSRVRGGVYIEAGSPDGTGPNIIEMIADPMQEVSPEELGVTPRGVHLVEMNGVNHIVDIVGAEHYPSPALFVEEMCEQGASRRIAKTFPFEKLDPARSKLILLHRRAFVSGHDTTNVVSGLHASQNEFCSGAWWQTVPKECLTEDSPARGGTGHLNRAKTAEGFAFNAEPERGTERYSYGVLAILPIERLVGIYDPEEPLALEESLKRASKSGFRALLEEM